MTRARAPRGDATRASAGPYPIASSMSARFNALMPPGMTARRGWAGASTCVVPAARSLEKFGPDAGVCHVALLACCGPQCVRVMDRELTWDALVEEAAHCVRMPVCALALPPLSQDVVDREPGSGVAGADGALAVAEDGWVAVGGFDLYVCGNL